MNMFNSFSLSMFTKASNAEKRRGKKIIKTKQFGNDRQDINVEFAS